MQELKAKNNKTKSIALEPASAAFLSTGIKGIQRVEGIGDGRIFPLFNSESYDAIRAIDESNARKTAKLLAARE